MKAYVDGGWVDDTGDEENKYNTVIMGTVYLLFPSREKAVMAPFYALRNVVSILSGTCSLTGCRQTIRFREPSDYGYREASI